MKGESFKINLAPKDFFDENPYKSDGKQKIKEKQNLKPNFVQTTSFIPSSPAKRVCAFENCNFIDSK